MSTARASDWRALKARIAGLEAGGSSRGRVRAFGHAGVDSLLTGGGLPLGRWHEVTGDGLEIETGAATAAFAAALVRPLACEGAVVWVMRREDLHAPGLFGLGFPAERLIQVAASSEAEVLAALEDALGSAGVAAAIGEAEDVDLTAGRRLQLACERRGATGIVIRRRPFGGAAKGGSGTGAETRWRVGCAPSDPAGEPGLGPPRWRVALERCRGGRTGEWLMEMTDGEEALRVVADVGDRHLAPAQSAGIRQDRRRAG